MLIACWSVKGGSGTTVVASSLALLLSSRAAAGAVVADLDGDVPSALGRPQPDGPGLAEWSRAADVSTAALHRLVDRSDPNLGVLARGLGDLDGPRVVAGLAAMASDEMPVVVDCGVVGSSGAALEVAGAATLSLLVIRNCYLALHRAIRCPLRPSAAVLIEEEHRVLGASDVTYALGVPVRAVVPVDDAIARAVDSGLLGVRLPRPLTRALKSAA